MFLFSGNSLRRLPRFLAFGVPFMALPGLLLGAGWARGADEKPVPTQAAAQVAYEKQIRPLLQQYCVNCHNGQKASGGINLATYGDVASIQKDQMTWRKVLTQVRERNMPPTNLPHPSDPQREQLVIWLAHTLNNTDDSLIPRNPGRVVLHRLSRAEYNNTVRDLFGIQSRPADSFPADGGGGGGFDNNADTLFVPPILMERYLGAASQILDETRRERLFFVRPGKGATKRAAAQKILATFAMRGFRRPVESMELARLMRLYDSAAQRGEAFENNVKFALKAVLVSPNFLFRVEADRGSVEAYPISDYELASRLSYFLWSSMPDDELFRLAGQKRLRSPGVLEAQVRRMLQSPKARALSEDFAGQWLRVRDLYTAAQPDRGKFPIYTPALRDAMFQETIDFFASLIKDDSSLLRLIDADYTYLNEELAKHYGIEGVTGKEMRRVRLADGRRGGILTMGSILTLTSYPQRTSPVLRGKWVLSEVLGTPPPPPPPVVPALSTNDAPEAGLTFRQRLEKHRSRPECASCHARMDPIGFGLENFDAVGRWRTEVGGAKVDSSGIMTTGEKFDGPVELKKLMLARKDEFVRNATEKLLAYALGRGLEPYDQPAVRKITAAVAKNDYHISTLIVEIVKSYPFQYRKNS